MRAGCPARQFGSGSAPTGRPGSASKRVTLFKSDSHMSQDGPEARERAGVEADHRGRASRQWVITTGTGGGIGTEVEVGDVIVSRFITFDCQTRASSNTTATPTRQPHDAPPRRFKQGTRRCSASTPSSCRRTTAAHRRSSPRPSRRNGVLTTDFFGFDTSDDHYGLQGKGDLSEMGDAVLGMVCKQMGAEAPAYSIVRNVSDPQIASNGLPISSRRSWPPTSTRRTAAGAPSAARSSAGRSSHPLPDER